MNITSQQDQAEAFWHVKNPIVIGILFTIGLFTTYFYLATQRSCQKGVCQTNFEHFLASSPNEIGDTLAGVAGILAFLWIIVTVFLQNKELSEQRKELRQSREEYVKMVAALEAQAEIFRDERNYRQQSKAKDLLDIRLEGLRITLAKLDGFFGNGQFNLHGKRVGIRLFRTTPEAKQNSDELILKIAEQLNDSFDHTESLSDICESGYKSHQSQYYDEILQDICEISQMEGKLPDDQNARIKNIKLLNLEKNFQTLLNADIWIVQC